jgi:hypothetical protein
VRSKCIRARSGLDIAAVGRWRVVVPTRRNERNSGVVVDEIARGMMWRIIHISGRGDVVMLIARRILFAPKWLSRICALHRRKKGSWNGWVRRNVIGLVATISSRGVRVLVTRAFGPFTWPFADYQEGREDDKR